MSYDVVLCKKDERESELQQTVEESKQREAYLENELVNMWVLVAKLKKAQVTSVFVHLRMLQICNHLDHHRYLLCSPLTPPLAATSSAPLPLPNPIILSEIRVGTSFMVPDLNQAVTSATNTSTTPFMVPSSASASSTV
ncbi:hypothetical protein L6452_38919 [Arctium lappa]|uniref:Uncharacterized protein n=1 Tax=Arctium lappa TaxID=4217 RepID=A0ACB8XRF4_ARCLA|nr:hypothetical protein L6452_38919 [Arctium lappa]